MHDLTRLPQLATGFNQHLGFELLDWSPALARTRVTLRPEMLNSQGIVHGGLYCTFLDFNCGLAGIHHEPDEAPKSCITLSLTTNFVAPARTGTLHGTGRVIGGGRKIFYAEAQIHDDDGALLATATGTFKYSHRVQAG